MGNSVIKLLSQSKDKNRAISVGRLHNNIQQTPFHLPAILIAFRGNIIVGRISSNSAECTYTANHFEEPRNYFLPAKKERKYFSAKFLI
jgi:hypothetical protein